MTLIRYHCKNGNKYVVISEKGGNQKKLLKTCYRNKSCSYSLFETDKAPGAVVLLFVYRPQNAVDLWFAYRLPGGTVWILVCSFHVKPVLWVAGRPPGAAEGQPVQGDCRPSELLGWALEGTGRDHSADCLDLLIAW